MKHMARYFGLFALAFSSSAASLRAEPYLMEKLGRGLVVVRSSATEAYFGWRLLGTDPTDIGFNLYRATGGGAPVLLNGTPIVDSTNYVDAAADLLQANEYSVRPVIGGVEQAIGGSFTLPANTPVNQYLSVPLQVPPGGVTPIGQSYTYSPNDASVGDLDGDGEYEIVLKWDPSNSQDNANDGYTGNVYIDAYRMNGTRLWRIDLGRNIRAGAHYTQFMVYDLDGDGKAEIACKTADGTVDGVGTVIGDPTADYRSSAGRILSGPEFLTIFNGETGAVLVTTEYVPPRGDVCLWGNDSGGRPECYGNRVDRFLAAIAYLDGQRPSLVMCRGYYDRAVLAAWNWRGGALTHLWTFDSNDGTPGNNAYRGQGNHNLSVGDIDGDGKQEIVYGAAAIDDNGTGLYSTGLGHGDALHLSDMDPDRPGLEVLQPHEVPSAAGAEFRDARTGGLIWGVTTASDNGRGLASDIDPTHRGFEMWTAQGVGVRDRAANLISSSTPPINFALWWDADPLREMLDQASGQPLTLSKWDWTTNTSVPMLTLTDAMTNNGTKANPSLSGDILGDWREEFIVRTTDNTALRIYTTTIPATNRMYTLMHDPQYRVSIAWQNVAYNQPPHPSFYFGDGMAAPPIPDIVTELPTTPLPSDPRITAIADDTGISATDRITSDPTLVLSGLADALNTVTLTRVGTGVIGSTTADPSGVWSLDYTATTLGEGNHFFSATASDGLGHTSGSLPPVQVVVDSTPPSVVSVARLNPPNELTSANSVTFRVTFSERVAGVTTGVFALTTTGTVTATISSVSASQGTTIDVTVSSIAGLGTLRLDVSGGAGIADLAGQLLTAGFTTGESYTFVTPTWIQTVSGGLWSDAGNWLGGLVGDGLGITANFDTLDLTADDVVHLDSPRTLGGLIFGDSDTTTPGSWVVDNNADVANTLTLSVASGTPVITVNPMGTGATATIAASLVGTTSFSKTGGGVLALAAPNTIAGTATVSGGVLRVAAGGTFAPTAVNVGPSGAQLNIAGGAFSATGNVRVTPGSAAGVYVDSGTAAFNTIDSTNTSGGVIRINGGTVTANSITFPRSSDATPSYTTGLIVTGGTTTVGTIGLGTNNSYGVMSVEGGSLTATGMVSVGNLGSNSARGGAMRVLGGTFTSTDAANGIVMSQRNNNTSIATFTGGVSTAEKLIMGYTSSMTQGVATLTIDGGSLYVGSGGIIKNATGPFAANINLSAGTLGAKANWASTLNMVFPSAATTIGIKAADAGDTARNMTLGGVLSGAGGLVKTGGGTLTLSGANTFTGAVDVNAGTLALSGSIAAGSDSAVNLNVNDSASLTGAGTITRSVVLGSGGRIVPGNGTAGSSLTAQSLTWNGGARLVSDFTTGGLLFLTSTLLKSGTGQVVELSTSTPLTVGATITLATFASTDLVPSDLTLSGLAHYHGSFIVNPTNLLFVVESVDTYALDVTLSGTGSGTVTSSPAGINCGIDCSETYGYGTGVTLTASPAAGSVFAGWSGDCSGSANPFAITIDAAKSCTATFVPATVVLGTRTKTVSGSFNINGSIAYTITLTNTGTASQADNGGHELVDTLPSNLTLVSASATSGTVTTDLPGNYVAWNGSIPSGGSVTITINATVKPTVALDTTISNQATISYDANVDGTNESTALTDDPSVAGASDPTDFVVVSPAMDFYTVTACRVLDTRNAVGAYGGPALVAGADRVFPLLDQCGIPATARAISVNLTVTQPTAAGNLRLYAAGTPLPTTSSINYVVGLTRANNAVVGLNGLGELAVYCGQASGTVHFILDVNGYFE
jgi:uncharacterized repeat protein (TIGR01451 family)